MHWVFLGLNSGIATQILSIYGNTKTFQYLSIFIKLYICNTCEYLHFYRNLLKWIKKRENRNDNLNSQVLLITNHIKTFLNVKSCDIQQQPIRCFKLFTNWCINITPTDVWEKVNSVQQLQNEHMWSGTAANVLAYMTHMENSQENLNSDFSVLKFVLYCLWGQKQGWTLENCN